MSNHGIKIPSSYLGERMQYLVANLDCWEVNDSEPTKIRRYLHSRTLHFTRTRTNERLEENEVFWYFPIALPMIFLASNHCCPTTIQTHVCHLMDYVLV